MAAPFENIYPLSPLQQGMLFHALYEPETGFYFQRISWRIDGYDLEVGELRRAWETTLHRHQALRTAFVWEGRKEPLQVVMREVELPWSEEDWSGLSDAEQMERFEGWLEIDHQTGFRFDRAPLMRLCLIDLGRGRRRLVWSYHHLILDGWSVAVVLREVFARYAATQADRTPSLPSSRPFSDYVAELQKVDATAEEAFWRRRLEGIREPSQLPPRLRYGAGEGAFGERVRHLGARIGAPLRALARRHRTTLNVVVQAAWGRLLGHYTGSRDVVFGSIVSGRSSDPEGWSETVGVLINTLPVRIRFHPGETVETLLHRLQRRQVESLRFEHTPLVRLQQWTEVPSGEPLFEALFAFENFPVDRAMEASQEGDLRVHDVRSFQQTHYPLTLMAAASEGISLRLLYDGARFDDTAAERILGQLEALLGAVGAADDLAVDRLSLLSAAERHQLLVEWNDTARPDEAAGGVSTDGECLHHPFLRQAAQAPDAVAVVAGSRALTYREVDIRSERVARWLRGRGFGPGDFVGVFFERDAEMIVALLAVLKAGAAYVPLDSSLPPARVALVLETLDVRAVLAGPRQIEKLRVAWTAGSELAERTLHVGRLGKPTEEASRVRGEDRVVVWTWQDMAAASSAAPIRRRPPADADDLAYVIFTSGSTGTPKGVAVRHRPVLNLIRWVNGSFGVGPRDRVLLVASLSFDLSVYDVFGLLAVGGTVEVARDADLENPERLVEALVAGRVTFWDSAPAALQQIAPLLPEEPVVAGALKRVFLSGDWIPLGLASRVRRAFPDARVIGLGGATEATVWSNYFPIGRVDPRWVSIPYGRPIDNARYHVLDERGEPCLIGVEGDLYIGGDCLAWGYFASPDRTARQFLPDPHGPAPGGVLYRTGDRARYGPDGLLEFLGRRDQQVKVRGFRIELGEIEAALLRHSGVSGVVVTAPFDAHGDRCLAAYVLLEPPAGVGAGELRSFLAEQLPEYMVPAYVLELEEFPVTANGKLDRQALPHPLTVPTPGDRLDGRPLDPLEETVAVVWQHLLGRDFVERDADFFELGGHSLLATRLVARLRRVLDVDLALRDLFEDPTVAGVARRVRSLQRSFSDDEEIPLEANHREVTALSFAQHRMWFLERLRPGTSAFHIPISLRLDGPLNRRALDGAVEAVSRRHEVLRTRFVDRDGEPRAVVDEGWRCAPRRVDLTGLPSKTAGRHLSRLARQEAQRSFDLSRSPSMRAAQVALGPSRNALLVTLHHLVADGVSLGILLGEVARAYEALHRGRPASLPELPVQYGDYAIWQRRRAAGGEDLERQRAFWKDQLAGDLPVLQLPEDIPESLGRAEARGARVDLPLPKTLSRDLRALSRAEGSTLSTTLMAGVHLWLHRLSGQDDVITGLAVSHRERVELEPLVGMFLNTLPIRTRLPEAGSFKKLLAGVRQTALAAYAHQDLPFESLVAEIQPERDLDRQPLFDVLFNHVQVDLEAARLPGIEARTLEHGPPVAKYALTLYVHEDDPDITLQCVYRTDRFRRQRVEHMLDQLLHLLEQVVAAPKRELRDLSLVTPVAAPRLPDLARTLDRPDHPTVLEAFDVQHRRRPEAPAIRREEAVWSYGDLDASARRIEAGLRQKLVAAGDVVAVTGERGAGVVAAFLAVWRAGAVVLPLDPGLPPERRRRMLEQAACRVAVRVPPGDEAEPTPVAVENEGSGGPTGSPAARYGSDAAYVFFTSGTTGEPQGVVGSHRSLAHFLAWQRDAFGFGPEDRSAHLTGLSFDVVLREIFSALTSGAELWVPPRDVSIATGDGVVDWLARHRLTILHAVPTLAREWWLRARDRGEPARTVLRHVFFAGEPLTDDLVDRWRRSVPASCRFVNLYGPTETTLAKCWFEVPSPPVPGIQPLGRALPQTQALVMTERLGLCGLGEPGEIVLRTPFRTLGALEADAARVASRWVPNPHRTDDPEDLLYRTGDLGRYRLDGSLEIVGRVDDQVKIRGVRVEPDEVTAVLVRHASVRAGVVTPWTDGRGRLQLVAYVVFDAAREAPVEELVASLRSHLAARLHSAMVPSRFLPVESLATNASGKVDRRALPSPAEVVLREAFAPPQTDTERALAHVWRELLEISRPIGRNEDFFTLGGHSLLGTRLLARLTRELGVEMPLITLFESPRLADLARQVERRKDEAPAVTPEEPIEAGAGVGEVPVSFAQQRMWFLHQLDPESPAYNIPAALRTTGPLSPQALAQSLGAVVARHDVLRTAYLSQDGRVRAWVRESAAPRMRRVDLSRLSPPDRSRQAERWAAAEAIQPFDLTRVPQVRGTLLRLEPREHVVVLVVHHIASDGWSTGVLVSELSASYGILREGRPVELPDLPIQYADYAAWQRRRLEDEDRVDRGLEYFRRTLANPPVLELPTDRPRPLRSSGRGATHAFSLSPAIGNRLRLAAEEHEATLFMVLLAGFQTLLFRLSHQRDVVVGTPVAGRPRAELEPLMGCFVNTLALRARAPEERTFSELVHAVRRTSLESARHEELPFEVLVDELEVERDLQQNPLFQVAFVLQNVPLESLHLPGLELQPWPLRRTTAKFDLTLTLTEADGGLRGRIEYATDLFDATTVARWAGHYRRLLEDAAVAPHRRLGDLRWLGAAEHHQLVVEETVLDAGPRQALHRRFESWVDRTPDTVALVEPSPGSEATIHLTYGALDQRANRWAHRLRQQGVTRGDRVALCLERTTVLAEALLAVHKVGAAYVPLNSGDPDERRRFILEDVGAKLLISDAQALAGQPGTRPEVATAPELPAYVIYTSGSTGRPKGVEVGHGHVSRLLDTTREDFSFGAADVWTLFHSYAFDFSVWEIWGPWFFGGRLVIVPYWISRSPEAFHELLRRERVTVLNQTPSSFLQLMAADAEVDDDLALRWVIFGGEELDPVALSPWFDRHGDRQPTLVNMYGITETTVHVTHRLLRRADLSAGWLGRSLDDLRVHLLDGAARPVPQGVTGELYVGGAGVTLGYVHRPGLTAARFVPDPWSPIPGARLYRSGDLALRRPDGRLDYLGRIDHQVKIRGFRIELGEIEKVLQEHPHVVRAVAQPWQSAGDVRRLAAYLVLEPGAAGDTPDAAELRSFCARHLPDYSIPASFVPIPSLPLTGNGKLDRRALPSPDAVRSLPVESTDRPTAPPSGPVETTLAAIWVEILGLDSIGRHDNFFELGGDSILSIQIIARARQAGLHLAPRQIFQHQTLAEIASVAGTLDEAPASAEPVVGDAPLLPIQRAFFASGGPDLHHRNQAVLLELDAGDASWPRSAWRALFERWMVHHDALRSRFPTRDGEVRQTVAAPGDLPTPWSCCDVSGLPTGVASDALSAAAASAQTRFDLARGPLVRIVHFRHRDAADRVLIVIHHLVVDGVSWRILLEDLVSLRNQARAGRPPVLPPRTTSFAAWGRRLEAHARTPAVRRELSYWTDASRAVASALPTASGASSSLASARSVTLSLDEETTQALLQDVPKTYRSRIDDALLTALAEALAEWTGRPRVLVDLEGHGREDLFRDVDLSRTVGWFTSVYPLLLEVTGDDPGERLKAVKEQVREIPRRGFHYGLLRYLGRPADRRALEAMPAARVSFNYLGQLDKALPSSAPFRWASEATGPTRSPRQELAYDLQVELRIVERRLQAEWIYPGDAFRHAEIEAVASAHRASLDRLVDHCRAHPEGGCTPSDFPLVRLGQEALDRLVEDAGGGSLVEDVYPLSPLQQGLLFHSLGDVTEDLYFRQIHCELEGELDVDAFRQSWGHVVDRHAILRSLMAWKDLDEPVQVVLRRASLPFEVRDWRDLPEAQWNARLEAFLEADRRRGLDLERAPLLRLTLLRRGPRSWYLVWSWHHLILDGWSCSLLIRDVFSSYLAVRKGDRPGLDPAPPYRRYVEWLEGRSLAEAEDFWRRNLRGLTSPTSVVLRRAPGRPTGPDSAWRQDGRSELTVHLSTEATADLEAFVRESQVTLNTLLQGAWALLLSRYGDQREVLFGAISSGRPAALPGVEDMVGLFINTLPVRCRIEPHRAVGEWLQQLQAEQAEARQYEYSPLSEIHRWSGVAAGQPLFESLVTFENYPVDDSLRRSRGDLTAGRIRLEETTNYPLTLMTHRAPRLPLKVLFDRTRFEETDVFRLHRHLRVLLEELARDPRRGVDHVPLLAEVERHQILYEWNDSERDRRTPPGTLLHQMFEHRARRAPEALAVICGETRRTYGEVDRDARVLAGRLRRVGVAPGDLVGVCLDRTAGMVAAVLGILKAGAGYVPLVKAFPRERIRLILESLGVGVVVAGGERLPMAESLRDELPALDRVVRWDEEKADEEPADPLPVKVEISDHAIAYVIFTSGSTGTPKGVVLKHRQVVNVLDWVNRTFGVGPEDRVLFLTSLGFDLSVYDIFGLLAAGGSVRVASERELSDPRKLVDLLVNGGITLWDSAPAALQQLAPLLPAGEPDAGRDLRLVLLSGDWVPLALPDRVRRGFPHARVIAMGGATEAAIWSNFHRVEDVGAEWVSIPYGRPIQNARYHVLDRRLRPMPVGIPGDLYIGGDCLASIYAREPRLTATKFLPDPFARTSGDRLYRTGDRARYWPDGTLEFLGRLDHQVKIRGYRIELGEIEAALGKHPLVRRGVVVVREDGGSKRLVAYVVPSSEPGLPMDRIREDLEPSLPEYMIPTLFVELEEIPLTANGKVDRKALPAPRGSSEDFVAPRDEIERQLASIWREVLHAESIGVHDNFFELGGDSILSIQIVSRAARKGLVISPRHLFEHATIAALATVAERRTSATAEQGLVSGAQPWLPAQHWFFEQDLVAEHHFNQAVLLEVPPDLGAPALGQAVARLQQHHDALRLRFPEGEARDRGQARYAGLDERLPFHRIDLSACTAPAQALERAAAEVQKSLHLVHGPMARIVWFEFSAGQPARLLVVVHHLVVDGVSWRILLEDLETLTDAFTGGVVASLPFKTTALPAWVEALQRRIASGALAAERSYWRRVERRRVPPLPRDRPSVEARVGRASTHRVRLEGETTEALLHEVPPVYRTEIDDVLLTALAMTWAAWTGSRHSLIALERHGRSEPASLEALDVSRTLGWFTSFFPLYLELPDGEAADPGACLKSVKEQLRELPSRGSGYGILRYLAPADGEDALEGSAHPEMSFNYLGRLDRAFSETSRFAPASESVGPVRDPRQARRHGLEINAGVSDGCLEVAWTYGREAHDGETIEALADRYLETLRCLVAHCQSPGAGGYTPSDFLLADLDAETLDRVFGNERGILEAYPLSPTQQGMLFFHLYAPTSDAYFQQLSCGLRGDFDPERFRGAWQEVIRRHGVLRTGFVWEGLKTPLQVVRREAGEWWRDLDWTHVPEESWREEIDRFLRDDRRRGFDLSGPSLLRVSCLRLAPDAHYFVLSFHHLLLDGWSLQILTREVLAEYEARGSGGRSNLGAPVPYREYIAWLQQQDWEAVERFWRRTLRGFTAPTRLPGDRDPGALPDPRIRTAGRELRLGRDETEALRETARRRQLTLNTLVQGAWALLLGRHGLTDDVLYGATVAGRPGELAGVESMVGLFINTLPVRVKIGHGPMAAWLARLQEEQVELRRYEFSPLTRLQSWSDVPGNQPLFESILVFENYPTDTVLQGWGKQIEVAEAHSFERTSYALTAVVIPRTHLTLALGFDSKRFDGSTIERLLGAFAQILRRMATGLDAELDAFHGLTAAQVHQLVREWNDTTSPVPARRPAYRRIFERLERWRDATALVFDDHALTYGELRCRAETLAAELTRRGLEQEDRVGVLLPRSPELIVALLAVSRAGAAYVPFDATIPRRRLGDLLGDCGATLLLTERSLAADLPDLGVDVLIAEDALARAPEPQGASARSGDETTSEHLAYVIYTSGSTGRPKGVLVSHGSLGTYAETARMRDRIAPGDRVLQFASIAFDASAEEIYPCLLAGATLVLRPAHLVASAGVFTKTVAELELTVLDLPTAYWHVLSDSMKAEDVELPASVRRVIIGGEQAREEALTTWCPRAGRATLLNTYGPTEATIVATDCELAAGVSRQVGEGPLPIGRPVAGARVHLLGSALTPVPPGALGEVFLGGPGLARGYLGRPAHTAEHFVPDPWPRKPGDRLYRTGDLARRSSRGRLTMAGRADHEAKIRGVRVQPAEVDAVLAKHPEILRTVTVTRKRRGELHLVAYCVPEPGGLPPQDELRRFLGRYLPEAMIPSAFVGVDAFPLTRSGKIDLGGLPAPVWDGARQPNDGSEAPRNELQRRLLALWREVLDLDDLGVDDDFFTLGGHSLLAVRLVSRLRSELDHDVRLADLFLHPTVAAMEERLRDAESSQRSVLVPLRRDSEGIPLFLIHALNGTVLPYLPLCEALEAPCPVWGVQAVLPVDSPDALVGRENLPSLEDIATAYLEEVRSVQPEGPYLLGGWSSGGLFALEMARQLRSLGEDVARLVLFDTAPPSPSRGCSSPSVDDRALVVRFAHDFAGDDALEHLRRLAPELQDRGGPRETLARIEERLKDLGLIEKDVGSMELWRRYLIFRGQWVAIQRYDPPPYEGHVNLFVAEGRSPELAKKRLKPWRRFLVDEPLVHQFPGDHTTFLRPPIVEDVAARLCRMLFDMESYYIVRETRD